MALCLEIFVSGVKFPFPLWSDSGESGVIQERVEWIGGEWSDSEESRVIQGRVEWIRGEWSELGVVEWFRGESFGSIGRNKPPYFWQPSPSLKAHYYLFLHYTGDFTRSASKENLFSTYIAQYFSFGIFYYRKLWNFIEVLLYPVLSIKK